MVKSIQTDGPTESDIYEPTMQNAQVGSKTKKKTMFVHIKLKSAGLLISVGPLALVPLVGACGLD